MLHHLVGEEQIFCLLGGDGFLRGLLEVGCSLFAEVFVLTEHAVENGAELLCRKLVRLLKQDDAVLLLLENGECLFGVRRCDANL